MLRFRQIIVLPQKLSHDIFKLPCVRGVSKNKHDLPVYLLRQGVTTIQGVWVNSVGSGQILAEDYGQRWWFLSPKEYDEYVNYYCNYRKMVAKCDAILANKLSDPDCRVVIVSGCAQGADALGERYAWRHRLKVERYPADWEGLGKSAGPVRNELMAQNADALIAFPLYGVANRGTLDMIRRAREHNLLIRVIH